MQLYKLTDIDGYTRRGQRGETHWAEGTVVSKEPVDNPELCTDQVVHAYTNPTLALLFNPIHACLEDPFLLWEAEGDVVAQDWVDKVGVFGLKIARAMPLPEWYTDLEKRKRVQMAFAILCAEAVLPVFEKTCPDDDRPHKAIQTAKAVLGGKATAQEASAAGHAAFAAGHAAYDSDYKAARAAFAAGHAAYVVDVVNVVDVAGRAADAAYDAACAACQHGHSDLDNSYYSKYSLNVGENIETYILHMEEMEEENEVS
jgi:hypothetical protein